MSSYEALPEAKKRAYHVVDHLRKQGFDYALHEVHKHCVSWPENAAHGLYDQLGLSADAFKQPPELAAKTVLGQVQQQEKELRERREAQAQRDESLKQRERTLWQRKAGLDKREAALKRREANVAAKEVGMRDAEKAAAQREANPKVPMPRGGSKRMCYCSECDVAFELHDEQRPICWYHPRVAMRVSYS